MKAEWENWKVGGPETVCSDGSSYSVFKKFEACEILL